MKSTTHVAALALALGAAATTAPAESVFSACEADLATYCAEVTPGHGRLLSCLYAHEDKISERCDLVIGDTADMMDMFFSRVRHVTQECGDDIVTHCGDVAIGEGRIFSCLHDKHDALTQSCAAVIDAVQLPKE